MCKPHGSASICAAGEEKIFHWKQKHAGKSSGFHSTSPPGELNRGTPCGTELTDGFRRETVPAGTVFYQQGDPAREVIFLQTGQIRVECIHSSGKKRVLCLLFEGIPVGEDECLFGGPREYRAVAVTACQIFRIPAEVFKRRAEASPALALKLFQISARKSQVLGRMLIRDSFLSVRGRVIQFLLSVSEPYGTEEGAGVRLTIRLTHQEVADFLGISRVVVSQCFQSLNREGLLKKTRQHYLIPDRAALEAQLHT